MECLLPYLCMVTVPHIMVGLEKPIIIIIARDCSIVIYCYILLFIVVLLYQETLL